MQFVFPPGDIHANQGRFQLHTSQALHPLWGALGKHVPEREEREGEKYYRKVPKVTTLISVTGLAAFYYRYFRGVATFRSPYIRGNRENLYRSY